MTIVIYIAGGDDEPQLNQIQGYIEGIQTPSAVAFPWQITHKERWLPLQYFVDLAQRKE